MKLKHKFTVNKSNRLLASRKENKQVNKVLGELLPHKTSLSCTQNQFEDFQDVMYAIGFIVEDIETIKVGGEASAIEEVFANSDLAA